jgi:hypothetical protein
MHDDPKSTDVWLNCPECHNIMVPLKGYEIRDSAAPGLGADLWQFLLFGWIIFVYNYVFGTAKFEGEKARLALEKKEVLPHYPNSQICPKCFHVTRRK